MSYYELKWYPQSYVTEIPKNFSIVKVLRDHWWAVDADGNIAMYGEAQSPQCNINEDFTRKFVEQGAVPDAVDVVKIPVAYLPVKISDYCD